VSRFLLSEFIYRRYSDRLDRAVSDAGVRRGLDIQFEFVPEDGSRLDAEVLPEIIGGYFSTDIRENDLGRPFFGAVTRSENLEWLHVAHAGTDDPVFQSLFERGVKISNSSGSAAEPIALTAFAAILALDRGLPQFAKAQRDKEWVPRTPAETPRDLRGQTMLIYGLGAIGEKIAKFATAVGMRVVGIKRSYPGASAAGLIHKWAPPEQFFDLLPSCDWLVVTAPLTAETHGLVSDEVMSQLPRGAFIVNVARGAMLDEDALLTHLRSGQIGGAYLDVTREEPLPSSSDLWHAPNLILTPHDSSPSLGNAERADEYFLSDFDRWARGLPLAREVTDR
jgi:D-2-hydroxyacid dehydrogenase (NADP+)